MRAIIIAVFSAAALVAVIFLAGINAWFGLSLKNEVRPFEATALVVNLLIAFSLQRFFTTKMNDLRAEKNVLIDETKEIMRLLNRLLEKTSSQHGKAPISEEDKDEILSGLRQIANAITDLEESVRMSHLESIVDLFPEFVSLLRKLKGATTGTGFPTKGYSIQQRNNQQKHFRSLKKSCRQLIFRINEAQK